MKPGSGRRILPSTLLFLCALSLSAFSARGYVPMRWGTVGVRAVWAPSRFPLIFYVNESLAKGGANISAGSDAIGAVRAAMSSWQDIQTADLRFADLKLTTADSALVDGQNLITMADTPINREILGVRPEDPGAVAQTRIIYNKNTGEITETDIVLNPRYEFSTNLAPGTYDLQAILTHELGHALGCDHSSVPSDTMFSSMGVGEFFQRYISGDATAFASLTYPNRTRAASLGSITGRISSAGAGIFGASIIAINLDRNLIYSALSEPNGAYAINGPVAGRYVVYAEPLDGPATPDQLLVQGADAYYQGLNTSFRTVVAGEQLLGVNGAARNIEMNFAVPGGAPVLNIDRMGRGDPDSGLGYLSVGPVFANPGETLSLWIGGLNTWKVASLSDIMILGTGVTLDPSRGLKILKNGSGGQVGLSVLVHIEPDAAPGPRTVVLSVGDQRAASTGGIVIVGRALPATTLYFPYLKASSSQYTGIALANSTQDTPAVIRMSGRDSRGSFLWSEDATVPSDLTLAGGTQIAQLERQFFNLPFAADYSGSLTVEADIPNVQGFFLTGDFAGDYLDGAEAFTRGYRQLFFLDALQDGNTSTEIHLMNIKDLPVAVDLKLVDSNGRTMKGLIQQTIPARGKISGSLSSLFGISSELQSAHVTAASNDDALAGFALITQPVALAGLNALPLENAGAVLYSPQFAVGDPSFPMDTRLNIVNVGDSRTQVTVALLDESGKPFGPDTRTMMLEVGGQVSLDVRSTFGLEPGQGYIKVSASDGGRLLGNVAFGSGNPVTGALKFEATIPLFASGAQDFIFSHIAQGAGYYTGLAFLAPEGARITIAAFDRSGAAKGNPATRDLASGQRFVSLLNQLIPETNGQVGGYVKVSSDRPVMGFEMFGSTDGQVLSAVPPQRLSK
jgi:hypothetical protein